MSNQKTSPDSTNATFLEASAGGRLPYSWQDGQQILMFGPDQHLANRFRAPESDGDTKTTGISGPLGSDLSASAALQSFLVSRLRAATDLNGSMEYSLTWKTRVTPAGRPICALRARARPISGNGCTGWVSPTARDHSRGGLPPRPTDTGIPLSQQVAGVSGWPTPDASAMNDGESLESFQARQAVLKTKYANGNGAGMPLAEAEQLAGWATPRNEDSESTGAHRGTADTLHSQTQLAGWGTPRSVESGHSTGSDARATDQRSRLEDQVHGVIAASSSAATERRGVLDAAFSRWLMQFPESWDRASPGFGAWQKMQGAIASGACAGMETPCASP